MSFTELTLSLLLTGTGYCVSFIAANDMHSIVRTHSCSEDNKTNPTFSCKLCRENPPHDSNYLRYSIDINEDQIERRIQLFWDFLLSLKFRRVQELFHMEVKVKRIV